MRLEYEIATSGRDRFVRDIRTIDRELDKQARQGVSREARTERQRVQMREAGIKQRQSAEELAAKKAAQAQVRLANMAEAAKVRAEKRASAESARQLRWRQNLQNRHYQQLAVQRKRDELAEVRSQRRQAQAAARSRAQTAARFSSGFGRVASGTAGLVGGGIRMAGATAGIAAGIIAGSSISTQIDEQKAASQLANQAGTPGMKGQLLKEAQGVKGFTGAEVISGLTSFTDLTGDLDLGRRLMQDVAEFTLATGAEFEDATAMAANYANALKGIEDPAQRAAAVMKAMRASGGASRKGAVETKDIAGMGGRVTAIAGRFSGNEVDAIQTANVLAQVAKTASGSPEEAMTAAENFVDMLGTKRKAIESLGIKGAFQLDKEGNATAINSPRELIADIFEKTNGDLGTMTKIFGQRGQRVIAGFRGSYERDGREGIYKQFDELFNANLTEKDIAAARDSRLEDPDLVLKENFKKLNQVVGQKLVPEIVKSVNKLTSNNNIGKIGHFVDKVIAFGHQIAPLVESIAGIVGTLVENDPFDGLGVIVGGLITQQLLAAGVSAAAEQGVAKLLSMLAARTAGQAVVDSLPVPGGAGTGDKAGKVAKGGKLAKLGTAGKIAAGVAGAASLVVAGALAAGAGQQAAEKNLKYKPPSSAVSGNMFANSPYGSFNMVAPSSVPSGPPKAPAAPAKPAAPAGPLPGAEEFLKAAAETNAANQKLYDVAGRLESATRNVSSMASRSTPVIRRGG